MHGYYHEDHHEGLRGKGIKLIAFFTVALRYISVRKASCYGP